MDIKTAFNMDDTAYTLYNSLAQIAKVVRVFVEVAPKTEPVINYKIAINGCGELKVGEGFIFPSLEELGAAVARGQYNGFTAVKL